MRTHRAALVAVVFAALLGSGRTALAAPPDCAKCHTDDAQDKAKFPLHEYGASVHAKVECATCHRRPEGAFDVVPHGKTEPDLTACIACHGVNLKEFKVELKSGVHVALKCGECHDAHSMRRDRGGAESAGRADRANAACLRCHGDARLSDAGTSHSWLPNRDLHARMRCIVCHAPLGSEHDHEIVPSAKAERRCEACHEPNAALVKKYIGEDDRRSWITNPLLFEKAYVPGAIRHVLVDRIVLAIFGLTILGTLGHGLLRFAARARRREEPYEVVSEPMYSRGLRLWHWTNAALMVGLAVTGLRLHFGGREDPILSFEGAFNFHNVAGVAVVLVTLVFFIRNAVTGDARMYLGKPQDGLAGLLRQVGWYLRGIFRGEDHPYHVTAQRRFNPLQQVTYASIMYGLVPLISLSGIVLLYPDALPEKIAGRPATWWFATAHYLSGAGLIAFLLGHLYLATTGDRVSYLYKGMIDGLHRSHVRKAAAPPPSPDAASGGDAK